MATVLVDFFTNNYVYSVILLLTIVYYVVKIRTKKRNRPPGPRGWPFLGHLKFVHENPLAVIEELSGKSHVVMFPVGNENIVVLDSLEAIKDAFIKQGNYFTGGATNFKVGNYIMDFTGIAVEEGEPWRHQRRSILNHLKDFGVGKTSLEHKIIQELEILVQEIHRLKGKPFYPLTMLGKTSANVISVFVYGNRFDYNDPVFEELLVLTQQMDQAFGTVTYMDYFKHFHKLPGWITGLNKITNLRTKIQKYVAKRIQEHEEKYDENALTDYVDFGLKEIYDKRDNGTTMDMAAEMKRLKSNTMGFFAAGSNSSAMVILWYIKHLELYPQVTERIIEEIDRVIGQDRSASWMDRKNMPYLEAFIYEVDRIANIVPLGVPHFTTEEVKIMGYDIPKRSMVFSNFRKVHCDPKIWGDPDNFRPERFIDEKTGQLINTEYIFSFGIGKRICPGFNLAKMQIFLTLTTLLQNFTFKTPDGQSKDFDITAGIIRMLKPFEVIAVPRKLTQT